MDLNGPNHDDGRDLDLESYPAKHGPSLVDVAAAGVADRLSRVRAISLPDVKELPVWSLAALGLAFGAGLGFVLISS